jgi:5,10-methylenetetrahydromethanopterin reductase
MVDFGIGCSDTFSVEKATGLVRSWESLGATNVAMTDHKIARDAYAVMTLCGALTKKAKLGVIAADPYTRHPALTASSIATVDEASNGRAFLWLSAGLGGHRELGIKRVSPATAVRECFEIIKRLLAGEELDFHGKVLSFNKGRLALTPRSKIPISIMSRSPKLLELAGEIADGVVFGGFSSRASIDYAMKSFKAGLAKAGREQSSVDVTTWVTYTVSKDPKLARDFVLDGLTEKLWSGAKSFLYEAGVEIPTEIERLTSEHEMNKDTIAECRRLLLENPAFTDELIDDFTISGTTEDCIRKIRYVSGSGINRIFINPIAPNREIDQVVEVFLRDIVPQVS